MRSWRGGAQLLANMSIDAAAAAYAGEVVLRVNSPLDGKLILVCRQHLDQLHIPLLQRMLKSIEI